MITETESPGLLVQVNMESEMITETESPSTSKYGV